MQYQFHYGKKFYQDKKAGYWISTTNPRIRAQVWVWKYFHGEIEKGVHIHHKDGNKSNNEISNLEKMTVKEHFSKHNSNERIAKNLIHVATIRPLTKKWHASDEGLEWHRQHGINTWNQRPLRTTQCKNCGKIIHSKSWRSKFCSNVCKSAERRKKSVFIYFRRARRPCRDLGQRPYFGAGAALGDTW